MNTAKEAHQLLSSLTWDDLLRTALLLLAGLVLSRLYQRLINRAGLTQIPRFGRQLGSWVILGIFVSMALHQLGFNLSVLLGAAGVLSVALGFAAQTSAANVISGLFVVGEGSFQVGDVIQAGNNTGEVLAVDMLSVKLRTYDNRYVRIPNETIIKSDVVNLSRFPIRRFDLQIGIAYEADIARARSVLLQVANDNPICLEEPKPLIILQGFGDSSVNLQVSVWAARENYLELRNSMQEEIKLAFDAAGIEIPFPQRTLSLKQPAAGAPQKASPLDQLQSAAQAHADSDPAAPPGQADHV